MDGHLPPQLKDIVTRYQPEWLYVDGEWDRPGTAWKREQFLARQPPGKGVAITLPGRSPADFAAPFACAFKLAGVRETKNTQQPPVLRPFLFPPV